MQWKNTKFLVRILMSDYLSFSTSKFSSFFPAFVSNFGIEKVLQGLIKILCSRCVCLLKKQSSGFCSGRWDLLIQLQLIPHWITGVINGLLHRVTRGCVIQSKEMTGVEIETERVTLIVTSWLSGALGSQIQRGRWNRRNGGRQGEPGCAFV